MQFSVAGTDNSQSAMLEDEKDFAPSSLTLLLVPYGSIFLSFLLTLLFQLFGISPYLISFQLCSAGDIIDGKNLDMVIACLEYLLESSSL